MQQHTKSCANRVHWHISLGSHLACFKKVRLSCAQMRRPSQDRSPLLVGIMLVRCMIPLRLRFESIRTWSTILRFCITPQPAEFTAGKMLACNLQQLTLSATPSTTNSSTCAVIQVSAEDAPKSWRIWDGCTRRIVRALRLVFHQCMVEREGCIRVVPHVPALKTWGTRDRSAKLTFQVG